jgi:hypothetical protein
MVTNEFILMFRGFARTPGVCHVVVARDDYRPRVLVGELDDNPGTSVLNATEEIGAAISRHLLDEAGPEQFTLFEYEPKGLPELRPSFYRIVWRGEPRHFSMPTWEAVQADKEPDLASLRPLVRSQNYTSDALTTERHLELIDGRWTSGIPDRPIDAVVPRTVEPQEFRRVMAPTVEALRAFTAALDELDELYGGRPAVDSPAMRELDSERDYRAVSLWENPISDTHFFGAMTLRAATDNVRGFAELFDAPRPPLYAHLVLARSALEASVISEWLSEPRVAHLDRVKRGMCERVYSAKQVGTLGIQPEADETVGQYLSDAASFGWRVQFSGGFPEVDGVRRPSVPDGINRLLARPAEASLGRLLWNRLSAVAHATWWGLQWALDVESSEAGPPGWVTAPVGTASTQVATQAFCILRAVRTAAGARVDLMGWGKEDVWRLAQRAAEQHELALLAAIAQGSWQGR